MIYVPPSVVWSVADVVVGRIVIPPVYLIKPGTIEVHRDGRFSCGVTYAMNAPLIRKHGRDSIFPAPLESPELLQAGMIGQRAIVDTLVAFFQDGAHDATEGSPGGVVVDPGRRTRWPDEDLKRVGARRVVVAIGYIPIFGPSRFLHEGQDARGKKVGSSRQAGQDGNGLP